MYTGTIRTADVMRKLRLRTQKKSFKIIARRPVVKCYSISRLCSDVGCGFARFERDVGLGYFMCTDSE